MLIILFVVVVVLAIIFRPATKDLFLVLAGGLCAAFGGFFSTWFKARNARKIKMEETIGRQKVDVYKKALKLIHFLKSRLEQGVSEDVLSFISKENPWVIDNEILLPPKFAIYWHSVRQNILSVQRKDKSLERMSEGTKQSETIEKIAEIETFTDNLAKNAEEEIRNELRLPTFEIIRPPKQKGSDK